MKTTTATPRAKARSSAAASKKKSSTGHNETLVISREAFEPNSPPPPRTVNHHDIARLAMLIYHEEGCPKDRADAHWFEAERRLREAASRYYREPGPTLVTR